MFNNREKRNYLILILNKKIEKGLKLPFKIKYGHPLNCYVVE
jgi:hypothetical protein